MLTMYRCAFTEYEVQDNHLTLTTTYNLFSVKQIPLFLSELPFSFRNAFLSLIAAIRIQSLHRCIMALQSKEQSAASTSEGSISRIF